MEQYKVCQRLQELGFPQLRRDDSWYFVRPDMLIPLPEINALYGIDRRPFGYNGEKSLFNELIYFPQEKELELAAKPTQIVYTVSSGVMAYQDVKAFDIETKEDVMQSTKAQGDNLWFALANLYIALHVDSV
jgi:hypothetical protein